MLSATFSVRKNVYFMYDTFSNYFNQIQIVVFPLNPLMYDGSQLVIVVVTDYAHIRVARILVTTLEQFAFIRVLKTKYR